MLELQSKYEKILEAYNKEVQKRIDLENKVMGRSSRPRITYPHPPVEPFKSTPLIEIPIHHKGPSTIKLKNLKRKRASCGHCM